MRSNRLSYAPIITMKLSHGIDIYLLAKEIAGLSPNTLRNYRLMLSRLSKFLVAKDPELTKINADDRKDFNLQIVG